MQNHNIYELAAIIAGKEFEPSKVSLTPFIEWNGRSEVDCSDIEKLYLSYDFADMPDKVTSAYKLKKITALNDIQNNFDRFNCSYRQALCYYGLKDFKATQIAIKEALGYQLATKEKDRLSKSIAELKKLQKELIGPVGK